MSVRSGPTMRIGHRRVKSARTPGAELGVFQGIICTVAPRGGNCEHYDSFSPIQFPSTPTDTRGRINAPPQQ